MIMLDLLTISELNQPAVMALASWTRLLVRIRRRSHLRHAARAFATAQHKIPHHKQSFKRACLNWRGIESSSGKQNPRFCMASASLSGSYKGLQSRSRRVFRHTLRPANSRIANVTIHSELRKGDMFHTIGATKLSAKADNLPESLAKIQSSGIQIFNNRF